MPLRLDENNADSKLNPGQSDYDQKFNDIARHENNSEFDSMVNDPANGLADVEKAAAKGGVDQSQELSDQESGNTGFSNNFTGKNNQNPTKSKFNWRRGGPIGAIIGILGIGGFGVATLFSPSLLLVHLEESFVNKFDSQNTSYTIRTNKIIAKKMTDDVTSGSCKTIKVACRFTRPSNSLLSSLNENGIKALDSSGNEIAKTKLGFPNKQPAAYEFTDAAGNKTTVLPKDFYNKLTNDDAFRAAFHDAFNPRWRAYSLLDKAFSAIKARFGFKTSDSLSNIDNPDKITQAMNDEVKGADNGITNTALKETDQAAADLLEKPLEAEAENEVKTLAKSGKGNAVGLTAGAVCLVGDVPGIIIRTARAYQMAQLIKYGMIFLTTADAIKAGHASPEEVAVLGGLLTSVVNGKSAMDAFGMKYSLFNDTVSKGDTTYQKFIPGGSAIKSVGGLALYTDSGFKKQACSFLTNPATGAAIDVATSESLVLPVINFLGGLVASKAIEQFAAPLVSAGVKVIASSGVAKDILASFLGDLTQNLVGNDVGNAVPSAVSLALGQTANAGSNMPMTIDQAVAYDNLTQKVQLAYAKEDQATLSPLDPMSSNTFLGSFIDKLVPFATQMGSFSTVLTSIGSMVASSPFSLFPVANAADPAAQYTGCIDPAITNSGIAAGPFCNIQYGIPTQYLNIDPVDNLNSLIASGDVDPETGAPVEGSALQDWVDRCTNGSTDYAATCVINNNTSASYAIYMMDSRIQVDMDGTDNTQS